MTRKLAISMILAGFSFCALALDIDVTFIDRLPNYAYDAPKNKPAPGDPVTFVGHMKVHNGGPIDAEYVWYLDGFEIGRGITPLQPDTDNTLSLPWTWDDSRHEIMLVLDPSNFILEASEENNRVFDFTDGLIVGIAVEEGLVEYFKTIQPQLGIGSMSFEDWFQRQMRIWNLVLMEPAADLGSPKTSEVRDRVRGLISYHPDGTLWFGNCPVEWKEVDMLWGKLASDISWYQTERGVWFYEGSLPHELNHGRGVPDSYIYFLNGQSVDILDDLGQRVAGSDYMPLMGWGDVAIARHSGMMSGDYQNAYGLFDAYYLNWLAGMRAPGSNTNGSCWGSQGAYNYLPEMPAKMYLKILKMDGTPQSGAKIEIYQRVGHYGDGVKVDNIVDFTLVADEEGRIFLPNGVFTGETYQVILKIMSQDGTKHEYRFMERTEFHIAYWDGNTDSWDYVVRTDFGWPGAAESVENVWGHERGETLTLTFHGMNFHAPMTFEGGKSGWKLVSLEVPDSSTALVTLTLPNDSFSGFPFMLKNADGKPVAIKDPYQSAVNVAHATRRPYAHFTVFPVEDRIVGGCYFNGLWSFDGEGYAAIPDNLPEDGVGPIVSYHWDFGDGCTSSEPYLQHTFAARGIYTVRLTATDIDGLTDTTQKEVEVLSAPCGYEVTPSQAIFPAIGGTGAVQIGAHPTCAWTASADVPWIHFQGQAAGTGPGEISFAVDALAEFGSREGHISVGGATLIVRQIAIPGDCDGDGTVSIGEVQKAINMFLGSVPPDCGANCNGDGQVSIGELQKVINGFLGVVTTC